MALLEKHFRNRFDACEGAYVFRLWGHDVAFTRAEFDGFVAERNRLWSNWTFAAYLAFGVAVPLWFAWNGWDIAAWALGGTALVMLAVVLVHGERIPDTAAEPRVPTEPGAAPRARSTHERAAGSVAWIIFGAFIVMDGGHGPRDPLVWIWVALVAFHAWDLGQYVRTQLRAWRANRG